MPLNPREGAAEYVSVSGNAIQIQASGNTCTGFSSFNTFVGSGNTFVATLIDINDSTQWEKGVYSVHTDATGGHISRDRIIDTGRGGRGLTTLHEFTSSGEMILVSTTPQTPLFFSSPNSILTADVEEEPSALEINQNSLIGRTTDNIAPLEAQDVRAIINVEDGANQYTPTNQKNDLEGITSDITLTTNSLRLYNPSFPDASLRSPIFHAQPYTDSTRPSAGEAGRIIFNASVSPSGGLQVDNGTDWVNV